MTFARTSIAVLTIQLALVSSIAAKYLYQRSVCPRVWARAVAFDPEMVMRGRYLSTQLKIDACGVTQPSDQSRQGTRALPIEIDRHGNMTENSSRYLFATLGARNGRLVVQRFSDKEYDRNSQEVLVKRDAAGCAEATLQQPVDFYLPGHAIDPQATRRSSGQELWVEVTIPPVGPPRPLGLAIKSGDGHWQPLIYR
jgi:hypothetical protein